MSCLGLQRRGCGRREGYEGLEEVLVSSRGAVLGFLFAAQSLPHHSFCSVRGEGFLDIRPFFRVAGRCVGFCCFVPYRCLRLVSAASHGPHCGGRVDLGNGCAVFGSSFGRGDGFGVVVGLAGAVCYAVGFAGISLRAFVMLDFYSRQLGLKASLRLISIAFLAALVLFFLFRSEPLLCFCCRGRLGIERSNAMPVWPP